jgi:hypothetical protein
MGTSPVGELMGLPACVNFTWHTHAEGSGCRPNADGFIIRAYNLTVCDVIPKDRALETATAIKKQTPWTLVRERTIPTERPPLVDEI